jgi:hypothetical protein
MVSAAKKKNGDPQVAARRLEGPSSHITNDVG